MRAWLVVVALAAPGCQLVFPFEGSSQPEPGDAPGVDNADAPTATPNDRDGDGVLNAEDNCPEAINTAQSDEDQDGVGDRCDNCPHRANPGQDNGDDDDLGDDCELGAATECIALFDGFDEGLARWEIVSGNWSTNTADRLTLLSDGDGVLVSQDSFEVAQVLVQARVFDATRTLEPIIGTIAGVTSTAPLVGLASELHVIEGFTEMQIVRYDGDTVIPIATQPSRPPQMLPGALTFPIDSQHAQTAGIYSASTVIALTATTAEAVSDAPVGRVGVRTNVIAGFDYILVVTRPAAGTCPPR
jgi:hypothetical protein